MALKIVVRIIYAMSAMMSAVYWSIWGLPKDEREKNANVKPAQR